MGEKQITLPDLTSDSWEELYEKLQHVKWDGVPIVHAIRAPNGKVIVVSLIEIPIIVIPHQ
jgi:hypothetical protein